MGRPALGLLLLAALGASAREGLDLVSPDGTSVRLGPPAAGKVLLVHFWATWCPSCREDLRALDRASARCEGTRVRVVAVDVGDAADAVEAFVAPLGLRLPILLDPRGRAFRSVGGRELPVNLVWTGSEATLEPGPRDAVAWSERLRALGCAEAAVPESRARPQRRIAQAAASESAESTPPVAKAAAAASPPP
jgi:thiol-disulfide isomerase/thioredoxin